MDAKRVSLYSVYAAVLFLGWVSAEADADGKAFDLAEISAFEVPKSVRHSFVMGQRAMYGEDPNEEVRRYPSFTSDKPLYGTVAFGAAYGKPEEGLSYAFALDESGGTGKGYDRLYFDANRNADLTDDPPGKPMKNVPEGASLSYSSIKTEMIFDYLRVGIDPNDSADRRLEVMPRLLMFDSGYGYLSFVSTKARKGRIEVGGQSFCAVLGHAYVIAGWFDHPATALHILPPDESNRAPSWWGGEQVTGMHKRNGTLYRFSATPSGDKLFVQPYDGPLGTFEIGAGGRKITEMSAQGALRGEETAVALSAELGEDMAEPVRSCRLPVGDYLPTFMTVTYGRLRIDMSHNYHSDGKPRDTAARKLVYGIRIREDEPFVFDFSNKPAVMFASPARGHRIKPGEELNVLAVLTDPVLDIMIRGLRDTKRKQEKEFKTPDGKSHTYKQDLS
ncbi:MAG: hypothetical protein JW741_27845, partial [Sedimentisphaerales bacterium]|nr:hypothetical protein [Sedimentisphaerales bacterium]